MFASLNKYKNIKINGFDSKKESNLAILLQSKQKIGEISELNTQVPFILQESFKFNNKTIRAIKYYADFTYLENGMQIVHEAKGMETKESKIKHKLFLKKYCLNNEWIYRRN